MSGWGCATRDLKPLPCTRTCSAEFGNSILHTGLEITAGQQAISGLAHWGFDRSNFCLAGHVDRSHSIILK